MRRSGVGWLNGSNRNEAHDHARTDQGRSRADQELTDAVAVLSPDAPADRPRLVNPLEPYIKYIEEAQQYLTPALTARLRAVLPKTVWT